VHTVPLAGIDEVFREVESGAAHFGVVPIENSTEGVINHTLDMFVNSPLRICGEVELRIHHHLLGKAKTLKKLKRVLSHQQSLAQCREWLTPSCRAWNRGGSQHCEAARLAAMIPVVAIAGSSTARLPAPKRLNIEDEPDNTTRF
jgi:chorismate mutase/prephenate dehydratase